MDAGAIGFFVGGLALLLLGAEGLVRGASRLAAALGVSPVLIGLTVVSFGTSSPELAICLQGALTGHADFALGNAVGSNIFNILPILGISALLTPLAVTRRLTRVDVPLMILASGVLIGFALDSTLSVLEGALLFGALIGYIVVAVVQSRRQSKRVREQYEQEYGKRPKQGGKVLLNVAMAAVGLFMLVLGAGWLVDGAAEIARLAGMSELTIGLTIIAAGTSLPEAATSCMAAFKGERDIAVGNAVGSNLFNILGVLGPTAIAAGGLPVSPDALRLDLWVMLTVAVACYPVFHSAGGISRWEGMLFLAIYVAYVAGLVATGGRAGQLGWIRWALILAPLVVAALSQVPRVGRMRR